MKKTAIFTVLFILSLGTVFAEKNISAETVSAKEITFNAAEMFANAETGTQPESESGKKHYFTAISAMLLDNLVISSWNRFVNKATWAEVTWDDITHFHERKMQWDNDWYWTNFVLHPYQGGLYYMGARAANLNQLESFGITVLGSSMWEWFCECTSPSKNDMVYTTIGAFAVGEMFYRLSIEADEISRLFGYAISPPRLYTEWVSGERARGTTGNIHELSFKFSAGAAKTYTTFSSTFSNETENFPGFISPELNIVYNDPYGWDSNTPYSQFEFTMGAAAGFGSGEGSTDSEKNIMHNVYIFSNGMLFSRAPDWGENKDTTIGFVFDYDFFWHSFMELTSLSPGVAIKQRINYKNKSKIEWQLHIDALVLGTTDYFYYHREKGIVPEDYRDYNYTIGNETVFKWKWVTGGGFTLDTDFHGYAMYVFENQLMDDNTYTGWEFIGIETVNFEIPVSEKVNIGLGNQIYLKKTFYNDIPKIFQAVYTGSVFARLKLK